MQQVYDKRPEQSTQDHRIFCTQIDRICDNTSHDSDNLTFLQTHNCNSNMVSQQLTVQHDKIGLRTLTLAIRSLVTKTIRAI